MSLTNRTVTSKSILSAWILALVGSPLLLNLSVNNVVCQALSLSPSFRIGRSSPPSSSSPPPSQLLLRSRTDSQSSASTTALSSSKSSSSSSPIPPPPALSVPVWSLAVKDDNNADDATTTTTTNMNIMTYCMPVSIGPPKLWALSIFKNTLTEDLFLFLNGTYSAESGFAKRGILQLLTKDHHVLVPILGKNSGRDIDKEQACSEAGWKWTLPTTEPCESSESSSTVVDCQVIPSCSLYLQVQVVVDSEPQMMDAGDHWVVLCQVINTGEWDAASNGIRWRTLEDDNDNDTAPMGAIDGIEDTAMYSGWLRQEGHL